MSNTCKIILRKALKRARTRTQRGQALGRYQSCRKGGKSKSTRKGRRRGRRRKTKTRRRRRRRGFRLF